MGAQNVRLYKYVLIFSSCYAFSYDITEEGLKPDTVEKI